MGSRLSRKGGVWNPGRSAVLVAALLLVLLYQPSVSDEAASVGPDLEVYGVVFIETASSSSSVEEEGDHFRLKGEAFVLPLVRNNGDEMAQGYEVDLFYRETTTERSGRIGEDPAEGFGLAAGSRARPQVRWDLSGLPTGRYEITATVRLTEQTDADSCNDSYPRLCGATTGPALYVIVETAGYPGTLRGASPYPLRDSSLAPEGGCVFGREYPESSFESQFLELVNLGSSPADFVPDSLRIRFRIRVSDKSEWSDWSAWRDDWDALQSLSLDPGVEGEVFTALKPDFVREIIKETIEARMDLGAGEAEAKALGQSYRVQLELGMSGPEWSFKVPEVGGSLYYYTPLETFTFPAPEGCGADPVETAAFAVIPELDDKGNVYVVDHQEASDVLYALSTTGENRASKIVVGRTLTALRAFDHPSIENASLLYASWEGTDSVGNQIGGVMSFLSAFAESGELSITVRWDTGDSAEGERVNLSALGLTDLGPTTLRPEVADLDLSPDAITGRSDVLTDLRIYVGTERGFFELAETEDGPTIRRFPGFPGDIRSEPLLVEGTGTDSGEQRVWFVSAGFDLYVYNPQTEETLRILNSSGGNFAAVVQKNPAGNRVFVGMLDGTIRVYDAMASEEDQSPIATSQRIAAGPIASISVWAEKDDRDNARIYATFQRTVYECSLSGTQFDSAVRTAEAATTIVGSAQVLIKGIANLPDVPIALFVAAGSKLQGFYVRPWGQGPDQLATLDVMILPEDEQSDIVLPFAFTADRPLTGPRYDDNETMIFVGSSDGHVYGFKVNPKWVDEEQL